MAVDDEQVDVDDERCRRSVGRRVEVVVDDEQWTSTTREVPPLRRRLSRGGCDDDEHVNVDDKRCRRSALFCVVDGA